VDSIDTLRGELKRDREALIDRLRLEFQALCSEIERVITRELQYAFPSLSQHRIELGETESTTTDFYVWFKDAADVWHISVPANPTRVSYVCDCVGFAYIQAVLRAYPNELLPSQVQALAGNGTAISAFALGPQLVTLCVDDEEQEGNLCPHYETLQLPVDERTKREVCEKLRCIREEIETAERNNDLAQNNLLQSEKEQLLEYLNNAIGKNKRPRPMNSHEKSARDAVRHGIKRAITTISKIDPKAADFLREYIRVGWKVAYTGPEIRWRFFRPNPDVDKVPTKTGKVPLL
jgi:hypothetical protein